MLISAQGYTVNAGFFPLFPLSLHFATSFFGQIIPFDPMQYFIALLLVSLYFLIALICFLIPISSGTFLGLPRYSLVLFPIFIALALVKNKAVKVTYSIITIILLLILFALFSKGYFA